MKNVSLKELLDTGAHFGHQTRRWNPKMRDFLYGDESGVHVFDLTITKEELERTLVFLKDAAKKNKKIIFVGTKKQAKQKIKEVAKNSNSFWVNERWLGGTLTNFDQIKKSLQKLDEMKKKKAQGDYKVFTKKERVLIDREIDRLERFFGGLSGLDALPDIVIIVDVKREGVVVKEANKLGVEVVGIVDSNSDPDGVDYPIPMNDDAVKAIAYVLDLMKDAILEGKGKESLKTDKTEDKKN